MRYPYIASAAHSQLVHFPSIGGERATVIVRSTGLARLPEPISIDFGLMSINASCEDVIAFGNELIATAHHYIAAMAEYEQSLAEESSNSQAVPA